MKTLLWKLFWIDTNRFQTVIHFLLKLITFIHQLLEEQLTPIPLHKW